VGHGCCEDAGMPLQEELIERSFAYSGGAADYDGAEVRGYCEGV